jgi:PIN domain nuclease of toxin-antitoxin system
MGQPQVILADTHVVLWLSFAPERVSRAAAVAIRSARERAEGLAISDITLFEVALAASKGRIQLDASLDAYLQAVESSFVVLPMSSRVCARVVTLPATFPKDPGDRIIAATALAEGVPLLTADREIRKSGALQTIW